MLMAYPLQVLYQKDLSWQESIALLSVQLRIVKAADGRDTWTFWFAAV